MKSGRHRSFENEKGAKNTLAFLKRRYRAGEGIVKTPTVVEEAAKDFEFSPEDVDAFIAKHINMAHYDETVRFDNSKHDHHVFLYEDENLDVLIYVKIRQIKAKHRTKNVMIVSFHESDEV